MGRYILSRAAWALVTLFGITVVTFGVSRLAPGGPVERALGESLDSGTPISSDEQARLERYFGLDRPLLAQYGQWLLLSVRLDFGTSMSGDGEPVRRKLLRAARVSGMVQLASIVLIYLFAVPLGVWAATRGGTWRERAVTGLLFLLYSTPTFLLAAILLDVLCAGRPFDWFPLFGWRSPDGPTEGVARAVDVAHHLTVPVLCLTLGGLAVLVRHTRAGVLAALRQDYVLAAKARGLRERAVLLRHALPNSLLPLVTLAGFLFPALLSGSVIVESIFTVPGMGTLALDSILERDYPTLMALSTVTGVAVLVGFFVSDVACAWIDPRLRLE